jgi:hypothetical protein
MDEGLYDWALCEYEQIQRYLAQRPQTAFVLTNARLFSGLVKGEAVPYTGIATNPNELA